MLHIHMLCANENFLLTYLLNFTVMYYVRKSWELHTVRIDSQFSITEHKQNHISLEIWTVRRVCTPTIVLHNRGP